MPYHICWSKVENCYQVSTKTLTNQAQKASSLFFGGGSSYLETRSDGVLSEGTHTYISASISAIFVTKSISSALTQDFL